MRRVLSRAAAVASGVAMTFAMVPGGVAAAASSASCPEASSTRLLTGGVLGQDGNKLWVYSPTVTQTIVCFELVPGLNGGGGAIVANGSGGLPPVVTFGSDASACTTEVVDLIDPVRIRVALGTAGTTVCLTVNDDTTSLTFGVPGVTTLSPVEIWHNGTFDWFDVAACPVEYALYLAASGSRDCMETNGRIV